RRATSDEGARGTTLTPVVLGEARGPRPLPSTTPAADDQSGHHRGEGAMSAQTQVTNAIEDLIDRLRRIAAQGGDRLAAFLEEQPVRAQVDDFSDRIDALLRDAAQYLRESTPLATPLEDMTVEPLHDLAAKRQIEGRSHMNKSQ